MEGAKLTAEALPIRHYATHKAIDLRRVTPMALPSNKTLSIHQLSQIFNNTTATYKFYWFASVLDFVAKEGRTNMSFWEVIAGMIAQSWYPIHYFKISFGKSDSLYSQSKFLQEELGIPIDADKGKIRSIILDSLETSAVRASLKIFSLNVPYRFLSPWVRYTSDNDVVLRSQQYENGCLYSIVADEITINPSWVNYLQEHYSILRDFTFWNLTEFLQRRNPNVPDLPSKLIKPIQREALTKQRKYWDTYIEIAGSFQCVYTGKPIMPKNYDLDHFIPWSFVSHNLLWNLLPADSSINSSKSNNLPSLDRYLMPFASLQRKALRTLYDKNPNNTLFEDYLAVHNSIPELANLSENEFYEVFKKTFSPLSQIAENMGFKHWSR